MSDQLKSYFIHHRSERNGTVAVAIIIFLVIAGSEIFSRVYKPPPPDLSHIQPLIDSLAVSNSSIKDGSESAWQDTSRTLFSFDPNTLSDSGYIALGFTESEINTLRKYQKAGGKFRTKSDFNKLFFVDDLVYDRLESYIDLPESVDYASNKKDNYKNKNEVKWSDTADYALYTYNPVIADLNKSDTTELQKLPGIGPYFARKIVEYRTSLGGYNNIAQLMELRNMSYETIDKIADKVSIDPTRIQKIKVNHATAQELTAHPYISFDLASRLVLKREASGSFENLQALKGTGLLDDELSLKLADYLDFE